MGRGGGHAAEEVIGYVRGESRGAGSFLRAAPIYWCSVYPQVCTELALQRRRAAAIPDPRLRRVALHALQAKRSNLDGAAAFAAFAPAARRARVIRAQIAFQSIYDYLDVLTEQPHPDPIANSRDLHSALIAAVDSRAGEGALRAGPRAGVDIREHGPQSDGGYLQGTIERCRSALLTLPSYEAVRSSACRLASYIVGYQTYNVGDGLVPRQALAAWARQNTPAGSGVHWWETAASAGSSLGLFALMAMAARTDASAAQAAVLERAYFPWIGALHSLLDSLIDRTEDELTGQHPLVEHYGEPDQIAAGLRRLACESRLRVASLPDAPSHEAILASMAALYLAEREAGRPQARPARREVLSALGVLTAPAMVVMRLRTLLRSGRFADRSADPQ